MGMVLQPALAIIPCACNYCLLCKTESASRPSHRFKQQERELLRRRRIEGLEIKPIVHSPDTCVCIGTCGDFHGSSLSSRDVTTRAAPDSPGSQQQAPNDTVTILVMIQLAVVPDRSSRRAVGDKCSGPFFLASASSAS